MALTKNKLIKSLKEGLVELGYVEFSDTSTGAQGLFIKKLSNSLFLSLGTTISRYLDAQFSASFYLSKTTRWGSVWGDIPKEAYKRVSHFLTQEERISLLNHEHHEGLDAWWNGFDSEEIEKFFKAVELAEKRLLQDSDLLGKIEESKEIHELSELARHAIEVVKSRKVNSELEYRPTKEIDNIPLVWFEAAETVLGKTDIKLNKNLVRHLAGDSWRQYNLNNKHNE